MNESKNENASRIRNNLLRVREQIAQAADSAGRSADDIVLIGVTKYVDADTARLLATSGCRDLGESRPQMLEEKATALADTEVHWHMIGHLQRNKVARTIRFAELIHSVDSLRLATAIDRLAEQQNRIVRILLEVNLSGEPARHGFAAQDIPESLTGLQELKHVKLCGLMGMAGLAIDATETRKQFASLRELREDLRAGLSDDQAFTQLSMGMSGDFELAIAEGATMVRIGSALFQGLL